MFRKIEPEKVSGLKFFDIGVNDDGSLLGEYFGPLEAGYPYYTRAAIVDVAGNVGYLSTDDAPSHMVVSTKR